MEKVTKSEAKSRRQVAEELLKKNSTEITTIPTEAETLKLIHELQVQQIELELQNEELVASKELAEVATQKYTDLYDFAP